MGFVYKNIPAFNADIGSQLMFDLGAVNDYPIGLDIEFATTSVNGGTVAGSNFTKVVSNSQTPTSQYGNTVVGDYDLEFQFETPFAFAGGGLIIRFSNPAPSFATDNTISPGQVLVYGNSSDSSGYFVQRFFRDADGASPYGVTDSSYIGAFRVVTDASGTWNGDADGPTGPAGNWSTGGNWSNGATPTSADDATFNLNSTYTVTFSGTATAKDVTVNAGDVTFALGSNTLSAAGTLFVNKDFNGEGTLRITSGQVNAPTVTLGNAANTSGNLYVDGATARLIATNMNVGTGNRGRVFIQNGGMVTVTGTTKVFSANALSRINLFDGGTLRTGSLDLGGVEGRLAWTGGTLELTNSYALIGRNAATEDTFGTKNLVLDGNKHLIVSGAGTSLKIADNTSIASSLKISGGATVTAPSASVGSGSGTNGTLTVEGAGSKLTSLGGLALGSSGGGLGKLIINTGGTVEVANTTSVSSGNANNVIQLAGGTLKTGSLNLSGNATALQWTAGTLDLQGGISNVGALAVPGTGTLKGTGTITGNVTTAGTLAPGNSPGTLNVTGDLASTGDIAIEIDGTATGEFDRINVTGTATLDGNITVSILPNYTPQVGDTFDVLVAGVILDTGLTVLWNDIAFDWYIIDGETQDTLQLTVIPEPASAGILALPSIIGWSRRRRFL